MNPHSPSAIERAVVGICQVLLWLSTSVIFLILAANTVLRYLTGSSLQWANEVPELLFPWLVMSGIVLASAHGAHITTTFLMDTVRPAARRVIGTLVWLTVVGLYATLSIATFRMLEIAHDERSPILQVPNSITYGCVMGGMALLAVLALQSAWQTWHARPEDVQAADGAVPTAHW